jgi:hypothetical protein
MPRNSQKSGSNPLYQGVPKKAAATPLFSIIVNIIFIK